MFCQLNQFNSHRAKQKHHCQKTFSEKYILIEAFFLDESTLQKSLNLFKQTLEKVCIAGSIYASSKVR